MNAADLLSTLDYWGFSLARVLLTVLWQSSIVFAAVAGLSWLLRKRRAVVRHGLWLAALLMAPALPLLTMAVSQAGAPQAPMSVLPTYTEPAPLPAPLFEPASVPAVPPDLPAREMLAPEVQVSVWSYPWVLLLAGYALGLALFVGWIALGRIRIGQWIRGASPATDAGVLAAFKAAREKLRVSRDFPVLETDRIPAPVTAGLLRPVVLLPRELAEGLSPVDVQSIAVHETAHIARRDPFILSLIALVRAALFFHPLVWLACRQVSLLAEQAADDAVLDVTGEPVAYARMLARLAEELRRRSLTTELAAGIVLSKGAFLRRVEAILSDRRDYLRRLSRRALALTILAALLSLFLASAVPLSERQSPPIKQENTADVDEPTPAAGQGPTSGEAAEELLGRIVRLHQENWEGTNSFSLTASFEVSGQERHPEHGLVKVLTKEQVLLARSRDKFRYEVTRRYLPLGFEAVEEQGVSVGDKTRGLYYSPTTRSGYVAREMHGPWEYDPMSCFYSAGRALWLCASIPDRRGNVNFELVKVEQTAVDGEPAYLIEFSRETSMGREEAVGTYLYRWWVLREKGCSIAKFEIRSQEGKLCDEVIFRGFEQLPGGAWVALEMQEVKYGSTGSETEPKRASGRIEKIDGSPEFPEGFFTYEFPTGTKVFDSIADTNYVVGQLPGM